MMRFPLIAALLGALTLGACGTASDNPLRATLFNNLKQLVSKKEPQQVLTTAILRTRLTPEVRAQLAASLMIVELPTLKIASVVSEVAQNGAVTTWFAPDGVGLSTKAGMLISTRGIGFDLMSSSIDGPLAIVTGSGEGVATRIHRVLDGEDQEVVLRFECTYTRDKSYVFESCTGKVSGKDLTIENHYWRDKSGEILSSKQWAGVRNGYMLLEKT